MPLARYFFFVGGVLLALLFMANAWLPELPATDSVAAVADIPVIRIHSDRKWPERVEKLVARALADVEAIHPRSRIPCCWSVIGSMTRAIGT